ncbi:MAG: DUF2723 domain-containing protein [Acidobacteria bacterium]|nr:DUF2723 domain-containing protein [Acidobacteriota bacterium]MBP8273052.1 DUF2723 domain-containing protein [Acidobacteriota bacterium]
MHVPRVPSPPVGAGLSAWSLPLVCGVSALAAYAFTLFPSVPGGDAGELIAAVATTGIPHPSGYPLYVLVTKLFTWLPVLSVAGRANLASAALASLCAALIAWVAARVTGRAWAGLAAGAAFAFSPTAWLYAISAEVFSLNNVLIAAELCVLIAIDRTSSATPVDRRRIDRLLVAGAFIFGLGLSNHATSLFFNGLFVAAMYWRTRTDAEWRAPRRWLVLVGCAALGLLPYAYLPIAAAQHPLIAWGDPSTLNGFLTHILRREYGTFQLNQNLAVAPLSLVEQLGYYVRDLAAQITWMGVALALWGLFRATRDTSTRFIAVVTVTTWAVYLGVLHSLATFPLDQPLFHGVVARFWQAPNLLVCVWIGWGVASLRLPPRALAAIAIVIAAGQIALHGRAANHRHDTIVRDYGAAILQSLPPRALVLLRGDLITNTTRYLHTVESMRPDVRLLDQEMLTFRWMTPQVRRQMPDIVIPGTHYDIAAPGSYVLRGLIDANIASRPVIICGGPKTGDGSLNGVYTLLPLGLCDRVVPANVPLDPQAWLAEARAARPPLEKITRIAPPAESWEYTAWRDYWTASHRIGLTALTLGIERHDDAALLRAAAEEFEQLIAADPEPPAYAYKNLGIARMRLISVDPASTPAAINAFTTYLRIGPRDDKDRPAIETAVRQLNGGK